LRVLVCYTGGVGSQAVRLLLDHPDHQLVGVLVHSSDKAGRDVGDLVGRPTVGITATRDVDELVAMRADCVLWHGAAWEPDIVAAFLRAGSNVYTGTAIFEVPLAEDELLMAACREGRSSLVSGGNIPGLISDVLPLFLSGYSGRVKKIRATQRNHVADYPSAQQLSMYLSIGTPIEQARQSSIVDDVWLRAQRDSARLVAAGLGIDYGDTVITEKEHALAHSDLVLQASGLNVSAGAVAGIRWTFSSHAVDGHPFLEVINEQTAALGLGPGWRQDIDDPNWRINIEGTPSIECQLSLGLDGDAETDPSTALNAARGVNFIPQLVAAEPGWTSVLTIPAPRGTAVTRGSIR